MKKTMIMATDIKWDTEGNNDLLKELPKEVKIPEEIIEEAISDYLSDEYGFCHSGFEIAVQ